MSAPRVALVGARRVRQGLGPFVARFLVEAGAEVPALLGTSAETAARARDEVSQVAGVAPRPYDDLAALLAREELDALAILSPPETHGRFLDAALGAGLSALCEKPLVWGGPDLAAEVRRLEDAFRARGLVLVENCQWPRVLPALEALHPGATAGPPRRFAMGLEPAEPGARMVVDALSHPLSVLQALAPGRLAVERVRCRASDAAAERIDVAFLARAGPAEVDVRVELRRNPRQPRRAWLSVDERRAERLVRERDYAMFLADAERTVPVPDPLAVHVATFVERLARARGGPTTAAPNAVGTEHVLSDRMAAIEAIAAAYESPRGPDPHPPPDPPRTTR